MCGGEHIKRSEITTQISQESSDYLFDSTQIQTVLNGQKYQMPRNKEYLHIWKYGEGHMLGILGGIDTSRAKKYSDWKYDIKEHLTINGPQNRYGGCTDTQWQKAIEFFRRPEITKRSVVNKENQKKLKELSYGGSQSIPTLRYKKVFKYDSIKDEPPAEGTPQKVTLSPNVVSQPFRNFVEIIFENHEKSLQSWHLAGYSFFAAAIGLGKWSPEQRKNYNLLDAVSRHTIQVFPKSYAAILLTFDNAGMWNLRSELTENRYLGQQLYISVLSPARSLRDEYNIPDNALLCGIVKKLPFPPPYTI
ncbi:L-ascorbate oxidase homolog isoform X2 [Humulus lupulus]|uniref:L-ascorbate oxidase homolog isoform X2 n=1 Tax=Humulus lupulus TaxID=3486 RepID=UPI002B40F8AC|nr:L-ascorbate oxidase homolog isoform X2 [Humulus lupulus]